METQTIHKIPEDQDPSRCRGCKALIYWIKSNGRDLPVNPDGLNHLVNCPKASMFKHYDSAKDPKRTHQLALFSRLMDVKYRLSPWEVKFVERIAVKMNGGKTPLTSKEDSILEKIHGERA